MQLAARDELRKHVHALGRLEGLDQGHDEGVVVLGQEGALTCHLLRDPAVRLVDTLQGIPRMGLLVLHQTHHTRRTGADNLDLADVLEDEVRILEPDAVHQLLLHVALNNLRERGLLNGPELSLVAGDLDRGSARLVEQERALAEVGVLAERTDGLAIDEHGDLSAGDDEEGGSNLALLDHVRALPVALQDEGLHQLVGLLLRQVPEDVHLLRQDHLARVVGGLLGAANGGKTELLEGRCQALLGQDTKAGLLRYFDLPQLRLLLGLRIRNDATFLVGLAALQGHGRFLGLSTNLAVDDNDEAESVLNLGIVGIVLDDYGLHDLGQLRGGELREERRLLEAEQDEVAFQHRADIVAKHLLQLIDADAEALALARGDHCVVLRLLVHEGTLAEAVARPDLHEFLRASQCTVRIDLATLVDGQVALLHEVDGGHAVSLGHHADARLEHLREECLTNPVLLLVRETVEHPNGVQEFAVLSVVLLGVLLKDLVEGASIGTPDAALLYSLDRGGTRAVVEQGETTEGLAMGQGVHDVSVHADLARAFLRHKKGGAALALLHDELIRPEFKIFHRLQNRLNLGLFQEGADAVLLHCSLDQLPGLLALGPGTLVLNEVLLNIAGRVARSPIANALVCAFPIATTLVLNSLVVRHRDRVTSV
mmetsp:Transcript_14395/g.36820  ORF Transcript_14395/g.36820 Transcript_14395/m.36820 type:complete len:654 (-) Transcript_14395:260-2221(-)